MQLASAPAEGGSRIVAVLGPTNTGKTHLAMERMLGHASGMIGFPLRLLARENYERAVQIKGASQVALITGEEKIVPATARYFLCTTESMPLARRVAFVGLDEVQMCADPDRGHLFTDRLLHAQGDVETMFMGAETMRPLLRRLVPAAEFIARPRFSSLAYAGPAKLSRLPPRTAVVAFSIADVYAIAELIRRERGGAALVLGALSPRTRNAQVAMYQAGEVDYLVATDAIGMGLNMHVDHVAFAQTRKFDGRGPRALKPAELAQIAGRAGRYTRDGTFGTTADIGPLADDVVEQIENHQFDVLGQIFWRNSDLSFLSIAALKQSLGHTPDRRGLALTRTADDELILDALVRDPHIAARARDRDAVALLWDVCQIPDFGKVSHEHHAPLLAKIYGFLAGSSPLRDRGRLPTDWVAQQVHRINRTEGDIETLMQRIANIRTWTYVAHQAGWLDDAAAWQSQTRCIEDRLSDALHQRLIQRFVDRRTASLVGRMRARETLVAAVNSSGEVLVEGHFVGTLDGFRFAPDRSVDRSGSTAAGRTLTVAALRALRGEIGMRLQSMVTADDTEFALDDDGIVRWHAAPVGRLTAGAEILAPRAEPLASDLLEPHQRERVRMRISGWLKAYLENALAPLFPAENGSLTGAARGLLFQVTEGLGSMPRRPAEAQIRALTTDERRQLHARGLRIGRAAVYFPALLRPAGVRLRALLWTTMHGGSGNALPAPGQTSLALPPAADARFFAAIGFFPFGRRAVRIDMAERLLAQAEKAARQRLTVPPSMLASPIGCPVDDLPGILAALGYAAEYGPDGLVLRRATRPSFRKRRRQSAPRVAAAATACSSADLATLNPLP